MLVGIIVFEILLTGVTFLVGWTHQVMKSPEQRHLDWLIDSEDSHATAYVRKHWPDDQLAVVDIQGRQFALI